MSPPKADEKGRRRDSDEARSSSSLKAPFDLEPPSRALPTPSRALGQNFLVDRRVIERIMNALHLRPDETIIEIGPGRGALTAPLLERAGRLIAVEFDRNLIPLLEDKFSSKDNFTLVQNDALVVDFCELIRPARQVRIVANLPYNIATAILQRLIEQRRCLTEITLLLQTEMVDRITAREGSRDRGFLSVLVEAYYEAEKLFDVGPQSFRPAPKIWSSIVRLTLRPEVRPALNDAKILSQVVSAGFAQRRKTILNNFRSAPSPLQEKVKKHGGASIVLCLAGVELQKRAETLTLDEWVRIVSVLN